MSLGGESTLCRTEKVWVVILMTKVLSFVVARSANALSTLPSKGIFKSGFLVSFPRSPRSMTKGTSFLSFLPFKLEQTRLVLSLSFAS